MLITFGFTESDRAANYSSFTDGYRIGARQSSVTIALEGAGTAITAQQWAEFAFVASNHPGDAPTGPARAIQIALTEQAHTALRSLSVGDTVHGQMWACESDGWRLVAADHCPPSGDGRQPGAQTP